MYETDVETTGIVAPFLDTVEKIWDIWKVASIVLSIFLFLSIVYLIIRYNLLREEQKKKLKIQLVEATGEGATVFNERWQKVLEHAGSGNPNDWRLAILEADIMLDELMTAMGYTQDTLGDKLKAVDKNNFTTIDIAWEAHKIRNQIAHMGSEFPLDEREVTRVIELYRQVFEEFHYI